MSTERVNSVLRSLVDVMTDLLSLISKRANPATICEIMELWINCFNAGMPATGNPARPFIVVAIDDLDLDVYQRGQSRKVIKSMQSDDEYCSDAVGFPIVVERAGEMLIVDGQSRIAGLKERGETHVTCILLDLANPGKEYEAAVFVAMANQQSATKKQQLNAQIVAKEPAAVQLERTVERHGFQLALMTPKSYWPYLTCVSALQHCVRWGYLDEVLDLHQKAWGKLDPAEREKAASDQSIHGMGYFLNYWEKLKDQRVDRKRLLKVLKDRGPEYFKRESTADVLGNTRAKRYAAVLTKAYNSRLDDDNRLKGWDL